MRFGQETLLNLSENVHCSMKKVAIIGTQGVPAKYGGFETLVENMIGENASSEVEYTVYCSSKDMPQILSEYKGVKLKYIPLRANGIQSIPYDIVSIFSAAKDSDVLLILGVSGCLCLPLFRLFHKKRLVINIDGLEHRRAKWGKLARWVLKKSESMAIKYADVIISDNKGIQDYVKETYSMDSEMIAYGGDHVLRGLTDQQQSEILARIGVQASDYCFTVCRIEPENNCHMILEAFAQTGQKLMFVGNWMRSEYGKQLKEKYSTYSNIMISDPIYDIDVLYALRKNCRCYMHGHSAGGTNPSLVEAMFFGVPIVAYDVVYNRESTGNKALYFTDVQQLNSILVSAEVTTSVGEAMLDYAQENYRWSKIAKQYESLY